MMENVKYILFAAGVILILFISYVILEIVSPQFPEKSTAVIAINKFIEYMKAKDLEELYKISTELATDNATLEEFEHDLKNQIFFSTIVDVKLITFELNNTVAKAKFKIKENFDIIDSLNCSDEEKDKIQSVCEYHIERFERMPQPFVWHKGDEMFKYDGTLFYDLIINPTFISTGEAESE